VRVIGRIDARGRGGIDARGRERTDARLVVDVALRLVLRLRNGVYGASRAFAGSQVVLTRAVEVN
jgi:hypothetical protein